MKPAPALLALALLGAVARGAEEPPLTPVAEVMATSRVEAARRPAVRVRGVVSLVGEGLASSATSPAVLASFCVEDESAGIWVLTGMALREKIWEGNSDVLLALREGVEIEIDGVMDGGAFAPVLLPRSVRVLGEKALPPARAVPLAQLMSGAAAVRRVEVSGVVQSIADEGGARWLLKVETGLGHFLVRLPKTEAFAPARLLDARVQMRGLAAVSRNWRSEFVCPRLIVSHEADVVILEAAPDDPFAAQKGALNALDAFAPGGRPRHRRRVEGTVTYLDSSGFLFLQDGACAVRVELVGKSAPLAVGDRVEATGFIDTSRKVAGLSGALVRRLEGGPVPDAVPISMAEVDADFRLMIAGKSTRLPGLDGLLVSVTGRLLSVQGPAADGVQRLELDCGDSITTAFLRGGGEWPAGTTLRATGVASVQYAPAVQTANFARPTRLDLLLRDRRDLVVLRVPPWWTPRRLGIALGGAGVLLVLAFAWAWLLRRQVAWRGARLAEEIAARHDATLEFDTKLRERTRLAADLHDTLEQALTGLSLQLEATELFRTTAPERSAQHLRLAQQFLDRSRADVHRTVWDLRAHGLAGRDVVTVLRERTAAMVAGCAVEIAVETEGAALPLPDFIAGNLLLLAQEAVTNALKHAHAQHITVRVAFAPDGVTVSVTDDGVGFHPAYAPGHLEGHFGLQGMRERVKRLDGTLRLESRPGSGARLETHVPARAFGEGGGK